MNAFEAIALIASSKFEFLTESDRETFSGVEAEDAQIAYFQGGVIIVENDMAQFMYEDGEFETFRLKAV
jgi:hypothetical protein